jgi:hypothetical protein
MSSSNNDIGKRRWDAADWLRANFKLSSSECGVPVMGLVCLKNVDHRVALLSDEVRGSR